MTENKITRILSITAILISLAAIVIVIASGSQQTEIDATIASVRRVKADNRFLLKEVETLKISNILSIASEGVDLLNVEHVHIEDTTESVLIRISLGDYDMRSNLKDVEISIEKIIDNTIKTCSNMYEKDISSYKFVVSAENSRVLAKYEDDEIEFIFD